MLSLIACTKTEPPDTEGLNDRIYGMLMGGAVADALAEAEALDLLPAEALAGLSAAELADQLKRLS